MVCDVWHFASRLAPPCPPSSLVFPVHIRILQFILFSPPHSFGAFPLPFLMARSHTGDLFILGLALRKFHDRPLLCRNSTLASNGFASFRRAAQLRSGFVPVSAASCAGLAFPPPGSDVYAFDPAFLALTRLFECSFSFDCCGFCQWPLLISRFSARCSSLSPPGVLWLPHSHLQGCGRVVLVPVVAV